MARRVTRGLNLLMLTTRKRILGRAFFFHILCILKMNTLKKLVVVAQKLKNIQRIEFLLIFYQKNVFNFSYQKNVFNFSRYSDSGILHRVRVESPTGKCRMGCCDPSSLCISPPKYRLGSK